MAVAAGTISIATFDYERDPWPKAQTVSWAGLVQRLSTFIERPTKAGTPLWSPAVYAPGTRRANENVAAITLAVADFDHNVDYSSLLQRLEDSGLAFVLHSTFRSTPEALRLRVVVPLSRPVAAKDWAGVKARIDHHIFPGCDPGASDLARIYYVPVHPPGALHFAEHREGQRLDAYALPEVPGGQAGENGRRAESLPQTLHEGTRNDQLFRLGCLLWAKGLSQTAIEAALVAANAEHCVPPLGDNEVRSIAKSASRYEPGRLDPAEARREVGLLCLADVQPQPVAWLWPGRIPLGKLTILDGDPGLGKSLITLDLAARVSQGMPMPDGSQPETGGAAGVVLLTAEDDPADTIRPRLDAAGADCERIVLLQNIREVAILPDGTEKVTTRLPNLTDIAALERAIAEVDARLVIVDPVMAYTAKADTFVDSEVRQVLARLADLAQRTGVAILVVRHLNKMGGGNPLYRGGGSIGFIASARSGLLVASDPDDSNGKRRILAATKSNLAELPQSLAYAIEAPTGVAEVTWLGASDQTAKALLSVPADGEERSALDEARDFLKDLLTGGPVEVQAIKAEAKSAGISDISLRRAKATLGVQAVKAGFGEGGQWTWQMPKPDSELPKMLIDPLRCSTCSYIENMSILGENEHLSTDGGSEGDWPPDDEYRTDEKHFVPHPKEGSKSRPSWPCPNCRYTDYWERPSGGWVCAHCHPNPHLATAGSEPP